jgi:hypothetical protein
VILNRPVSWNGRKVLRHELQYVRHDCEVDIQIAQEHPRPLPSQGIQLKHRNCALFRGRFEGVVWDPWSIWCTEDPCDGIALA